MMTHRERVLAALNHQKPDRVPIDFAGTFASTITSKATRGSRGTWESRQRRPSQPSQPDTNPTRRSCNISISTPGHPTSRPGRMLISSSGWIYLDEWGSPGAALPKGHFTSVILAPHDPTP
jgi:hypothetical protein